MILEVSGTQLHYDQTAGYSVDNLAPVCIHLYNIFVRSGTNTRDRAKFIFDIVRSNAMLLPEKFTCIKPLD